MSLVTSLGLLDSVVDLDYTFINRSSVLLTWTAPYTLDNVPITGYYIVNGLVNITTTNKSIILSATNPDPCILNNVSVSPINGVGIGSSNNISFYYERGKHYYGFMYVHSVSFSSSHYSSCISGTSN